MMRYAAVGAGCSVAIGTGLTSHPGLFRGGLFVVAPPRLGFVPPPRRWEQGRTTRPAGACPVGRLPTLPFRNLLGGACSLCRLPTLPLAYFPAPIPPTPFPSGEGGDQGYFMQGAPPLASPGLNPWFAAKPIESVPGKWCRPGSAAGYLLFGRFCKCRKRSDAGVPGAKPPAK